MTMLQNPPIAEHQAYSYGDAATTPGQFDPTDQSEQEVDIQLELFHQAIEQEGYKYEDNEDSRMGRANSAHNVRFGVMTDEAGNTQRVAVKTFEGVGTRPTKRAESEIRIMAKVAQRGFSTLESFESPVFTVPNEKGETVFAVSKRRDELKAMNGLNWQVDPENDEFESMVDLIEVIADFTAEIHAAGIIHNDWQLKNIIMSSQGEFVLVDLEKAMMHREGLSTSTDPAQLVRDVRVLFVSLLDHGFMPNSPQRKVYDVLENHLVDRYLEGLRTHALTGNGSSGDAKRALLLRGVEEAVITSIHAVEEKRAVNPVEQPRIEALARYAGSAISELAKVERVSV